MSNAPAILKKTESAKNFLVKFKPLIGDYATKDYNHDVWLKAAMMCIVDSDALQKCIATPAGQASLYHALRYAAGTGLSLNPQEGKAALIAYGDKVEYQVMKGGMIELAMASGKVAFITADTVFENDEFKIKKTMNGDEYEFCPALADRGSMMGHFAALKMVSGIVHVKWIDIANMELHKKQYGKGLNSAGSAWNKSFDGMAIKTVLKALLRTIEISPDLTGAVVSDDKFEAGAESEIDITPEDDGPGTSADQVQEKIDPKPEQEQAEAPKAEVPQGAAETDDNGDPKAGNPMF